jgi:hypothetical protein
MEQVGKGTAKIRQLHETILAEIKDETTRAAFDRYWQSVEIEDASRDVYLQMFATEGGE